MPQPLNRGVERDPRATDRSSGVRSGGALVPLWGSLHIEGLSREVVLNSVGKGVSGHFGTTIHSSHLLNCVAPLVPGSLRA